MNKFFSSCFRGHVEHVHRTQFADDATTWTDLVLNNRAEMSVNATASSSSSTPKVPDDLDIEKILNREASAFQREVEVERILKSFKLKLVTLFYSTLSRIAHNRNSAYDILDIDENASADDIKKKYRQISLCELCYVATRG